MTVKILTSSTSNSWKKLRSALWPECPDSEHFAEMEQIVNSDSKAAFLLEDDAGCPLGFMEVSLKEYVNGCASSPVAFVEGIFVLESHRRRGLASRLIKEAENWAQNKGCSELASDALIENVASHRFHKDAGFITTETVVFFKKSV